MSERGTQEDRYLVVSADGHAGPPVRAFREFVDRSYLGEFDQYAGLVEAFDSKLEELTPGAPGHTTRGNVRASLNGNRMVGLWDPGERLAVSEEDGIVAEVIFPQGSVPFHVYPSISSIPGLGEVTFPSDEEMLKAGIRAYNRWLAAFCGANPGRRAGIGVVPIVDIEAAVKEVEWIHNAGLTGGISLPAINAERPGYNNQIYDPLWEVCQSLAMTVNVHGGGVRTPFFGDGPDVRALRLCETDWYMRRTLWFMIFGGALERYPRLHLTFTEQRTHWAGPLIKELDSIYEAAHSRAWEYLPRRPSEYFQQSVYLGGSFLSHREVTDRGGINVDRLMWGADYPHVEGTWPFTRESLRMTFAGLPVEEVQMMLGTNAIQCYGLDESVLRPIANRVGPTLKELNEPVTGKPPGAELSWGFRIHGPWS